MHALKVTFWWPTKVLVFFEKGQIRRTGALIHILCCFTVAEFEILLPSVQFYWSLCYVWFHSVACLASLQRHGECLALVNKRLEEETDNPDLYIMRARLHELFRNVSNWHSFVLKNSFNFFLFTLLDCLTYYQLCAYLCLYEQYYYI